jgi:hypothetical protein
MCKAMVGWARPLQAQVVSYREQMLGCPLVVQDIAVPHLRVTIKVAPHIMKGWQAVYLLIEVADGIVVIVGVDIHKVDHIPCWVEQENQFQGGSCTNKISY